MRVTVCQLHDDPELFGEDWDRLAAHVREEKSELVLLPELPFIPWFAWSPRMDPAVWTAAEAAHRLGEERLAELSPALVLGSRPVTRAGRRINEGFVFSPEVGCRPAHAKYYLPDEEGFWEASWYERGDGSFRAEQCGKARVGFLICTELWFTARAREYAAQGAQLLVCPRATQRANLEKWLVGGRAAAVMGGAFCLSSNRVGGRSDLGGQGWIVEPDGEVLALTSGERPLATLDLDLDWADRAKKTYPRYLPD